MRRRIKRMNLRGSYAAAVASDEGLEVEASHAGFRLSYHNTWGGIKEDCDALAEKIRRPKQLDSEAEEVVEAEEEQAAPVLQLAASEE